MLKDLNTDEQNLEELMSQISEKGYSAGWMQNLEFALWNAINGGNKEYGQYIITQNDIDELKSLSQKCGCWIIFDNEKEETSLDIEDWGKMY